MPHHFEPPNAAEAALLRRAAPECQIICQTIIDPWSPIPAAARTIAQVEQPSPKEVRAALDAAHNCNLLLASIVALPASSLAILEDDPFERRWGRKMEKARQTSCCRAFVVEIGACD
jgi:hypothetical protein